MPPTHSTQFPLMFLNTLNALAKQPQTAAATPMVEYDGRDYYNPANKELPHSRVKRDQRRWKEFTRLLHQENHPLAPLALRVRVYVDGTKIRFLLR